MSYFIRIFCKSPAQFTRRSLAEFILEGTYFGEGPRFDPSLDSPEADDLDWNSFLVEYQADKRPIRIERNSGDPLTTEEIRELLFILERSRTSKPQQEILDHLRSTTQIIAFEIDQPGLTDDSWEMLDALEACLAGKYDGIVYSPDDGFYDQKLRKIYRL